MVISLRDVREVFGRYLDSRAAAKSGCLPEWPLQSIITCSMHSAQVVRSPRKYVNGEKKSQAARVIICI